MKKDRFVAPVRSAAVNAPFQTQGVQRIDPGILLLVVILNPVKIQYQGSMNMQHQGVVMSLLSAPCLSTWVVPEHQPMKANPEVI